MQKPGKILLTKGAGRGYAEKAGLVDDGLDKEGAIGNHMPPDQLVVAKP